MRPVLVCVPNIRGDGGIAAYARTLVEALGPRPVEVLDLAPGKALHALPSHARIVGEASGIAGFSARLAREWLRRPAGSEVVFAHFGLTRPLVVLPKLHRTTVLAHGMEVWSRLPRLRSQGLTRVDRMVFTTTYTRDQFVQWNGSLARGMEKPVVPLTVGPGWETRQLANREPRKKKTILCISRLTSSEPLKGISTLLAAAKELPPEVEVVLAGDGDGRAAYEREAAALGVAGRVRFLGWVSEENKARLLDECALLCLPSAQEGFGLVLLEALAAGRPCVGAAAGALPEVLASDVAELAPYGDAKALAAAIRRVLARSDAGELTPEQVRAAYVERFGWERFRTAWKTILR